MTIRDDVRHAFDRQQSALGDPSDARHRLMHRAMAAHEQGSNRGWQWAGAVAAVLIAAIVITTFALVKARSHENPGPAATPSPRAQTSPTPLGNQLNVDNSTPVILYHDPANFDQLDGVTWDGKTSGRIGLGVNLGGGGNPQGTLYVTSSNDIRNRAGIVVDTYDGSTRQRFFADDGVHYCDAARTKARDLSSPGMLEFGVIGHQPRNVTTFGTFNPAQMQGGGPVVIACSPAADRAVIYEAPPGGVGVVYFAVIQLSTGHTIWSNRHTGAWIVASHDGMYVAVSPAPGAPTVIYGPNGARVGQMQDGVFAFTWDDKLVVAAPNYGGPPSLEDWRDGQTIWTCPKSTYQYTQSFAEPGGTHIAIGAYDPIYKDNGFRPVDLFVVGPDAVVAFVKKDVVLAQF